MGLIFRKLDSSYHMKPSILVDVVVENKGKHCRDHHLQHHYGHYK